MKLIDKTAKNLKRLESFNAFEFNGDIYLKLDKKHNFRLCDNQTFEISLDSDVRTYEYGLNLKGTNKAIFENVKVGEFLIYDGDLCLKTSKTECFDSSISKFIELGCDTFVIRMINDIVIY